MAQAECLALPNLPFVRSRSQSLFRKHESSIECWNRWRNRNRPAMPVESSLPRTMCEIKAGHRSGFVEALAAKKSGDRRRIPYAIDALARPRFHWSCCCIAATCACDCWHLTPSIPVSNRFDRLQGGALSVHAERRSHRRRSALLPCRTRKADYENLLLTLIKVGPDACQMFPLGRCLLPLINRATFGIHSC